VIVIVIFSITQTTTLYMIDYFDSSIFVSQPGKYRLINCLAHIAGLALNHPQVYQYHYEGITYRGLTINENDLTCYTNGNYILNRSFVSTSKDRSVATIFSCFEQEHDPTTACVLFKYRIASNATAVDIERISSIKDEQEVVILPFSLFQVTHREPIYSKESSQVLHEIHLEECLDKQIQQGE